MKPKKSSLEIVGEHFLIYDVGGEVRLVSTLEKEHRLIRKYPAYKNTSKAMRHSDCYIYRENE